MSDMSTRPRSPIDVLSQADFFAALTLEQLKRICGVSQMQECEEGCRIYNHGDPAKDFYVLVEGMVR